MKYRCSIPPYRSFLLSQDHSLSPDSSVINGIKKEETHEYFSIE